jgi:hypothetical protein
MKLLMRTLNESGNCSDWMTSKMLIELAVYQKEGDRRRNEDEIWVGNM